MVREVRDNTEQCRVALEKIDSRRCKKNEMKTMLSFKSISILQILSLLSANINYIMIISNFMFKQIDVMWIEYHSVLFIFCKSIFHIEVFLCCSLNVCSLQNLRIYMLRSTNLMWNRDLYMLVLGTQTGTATMENNMENPSQTTATKKISHKEK